MRAPRRWSLGFLAVLFVGLALLGGDAYMEVKGRLAEHLIARAFATSLQTAQPRAPWSWADFHPVAKLQIDRLKVTRYVLSDATGTAMAFGLGHVVGTSAPNRPGLSAVAGHRDSWAGFLQHLRRGDSVTVTTLDGVYRYRVGTLDVVRQTDTWILDPAGPGAKDQRRLSLITCYPFDAWGETGLRYAVTCTADSALDAVSTHDLEKTGVVG